MSLLRVSKSRKCFLFKQKIGQTFVTKLGNGKQNRSDHWLERVNDQQVNQA